jgi:hypothetical protein
MSRDPKYPTLSHVTDEEINMISFINLKFVLCILIASIIFLLLPYQVEPALRYTVFFAAIVSGSASICYYDVKRKINKELKSIENELIN